MQAAVGGALGAVDLMSECNPEGEVDILLQVFATAQSANSSFKPCSYMSTPLLQPFMPTQNHVHISCWFTTIGSFGLFQCLQGKKVTDELKQLTGAVSVEIMQVDLPCSDRSAS